MTKPYHRLRLIAALLLLVTSFIIYSCTKGTYIGDEPTPDETAAQMKEWLSAQKKDSRAAARLMVQAEWGKAHSLQADSGYLYQVVPLSDTSSVKFEPGKALRRYLVVRRLDKVVKDGYVYETFGRADELERMEDQLLTGFAHKTIANRFTGNLAKLTLRGMFDESFTYTEGEFYRHSKAVAVSGSSVKGLQSRAEDKISQNFSCINYWMFVVDQSGNIVSMSYMYSTCTCEAQSSSVRNGKGEQGYRLSGCGEDGGGVTIYPGEGGGRPPDGGGGSGGPPPCPPYVIQSVKSGKVVMDIISPCVPIVPPVVDTVITTEFAENDKAMCALEKLMQNSFYKNTLNNFIGESKPIDLTFRLEPIVELPGFINYGKTIPNPASWNSQNIDLSINSNRIDEMPSIQVAATLLHEGIHAEIYRKLLSIHGPSNLNINNFPSLFDSYSTYKNNEPQHQFMADYYITIMSNALKQYDNNKFNISFYEALAWRGLEGTTAWKAKSDTVAIKDRAKQMLDGRSKIGCND